MLAQYLKKFKKDLGKLDYRCSSLEKEAQRCEDLEEEMKESHHQLQEYKK
jgi:hypothetical protein